MVGGTGTIGSIIGGFGEDGDSIEPGASLMTSSEGESIKIHIGRQSRLYKEFFNSGYYKNRSYRMGKILKQDNESITTDKRRVLLFDATDSGLSIDSVIEIKFLFQTMIKDAKEMGLELFIIISANEYELARGERCLDVNKGKFLSFPTYDDYRKFIISSRKWKDKRRERELSCIKKKKEKAKEKYLPLIEEIENRAKKENRSLSFVERREIDEYKRKIEGE